MEMTLTINGNNVSSLLIQQTINPPTFTCAITANNVTTTHIATCLAYNHEQKNALFMIDNQIISVSNIQGSLSNTLSFAMNNKQITASRQYKEFQLREAPLCKTDSKYTPTNRFKSPLAGRVISIFVAPGQEIKKGQPLLIIESMKMENELCANHDAFIKTVFIAPGNVVQTNQELIIFELKGELDANTKNGHGQATIQDW